ncbi:MAG: YceD family protein [Dictyoglomaceae bacterium]|nr:YceD family protein [Dictyoglomaceae bacterium]
MYIFLADLHSQVGKELLIEEDLSLNYEDLEFDAPVHVNLLLTNLGREVLVKGKIKGTVELNCSRCLKKFPYNLNIEIEEIYLWDLPIIRNIAPSEEIELKEEDFKFVLEKESLFLDPLVEDNIRISLPIKPLCSSNCKGLCPICGHDLNLGPCECSKDLNIDPRWEPLKNLFKEKGGK